MLEWVPSAICFVFGHNWYTPDTPENEGDAAGLEYCRRVPVETVLKEDLTNFVEYMSNGQVDYDELTEEDRDRLIELPRP